MRSPQPLLLLLLFSMLVSTALLAQQPTKAKTKTNSNTTKTKTESGKIKIEPGKTKVKGDTTGMTTQNPAMQGSGGGSGDMTLPYTAAYSSQFTIGNPNHARIVLQLWKAWDNGTIDQNTSLLADTMTMETADGMIMRGLDSFLIGAKQYRAMYPSIASTVEAYMPLRSNDRNESWVAIWGSEKATGTDGKVTTNRLQEIWRINRDGKVDYIRQYMAKPVPMQ